MMKRGKGLIQREAEGCLHRARWERIVPVPPWVRENESRFKIWRGKWIKEGVNFLGRKSEEDFDQMLQRLCHGYVSICQHCYFLSSACTHTPDSQCTLKSLSLPGAELKGKRVILHPQSSYHCKILSFSVPAMSLSISVPRFSSHKSNKYNYCGLVRTVFVILK